jgi:hypothetical protein
MNEPPEKLRWRERIYNLFPTLERGERKQLVERIAVGADGGVDFVVMMLLAATLASLGLLEGSTAVVIGAMLVATNLVAIILGASLVFRLLGLHRSGSSPAGAAPRWVGAAGHVDTGAAGSDSVRTPVDQCTGEEPQWPDATGELPGVR